MINIHPLAFFTDLLNKSTSTKCSQSEGVPQYVKWNLQPPVSQMICVLGVNTHIKHPQLYNNALLCSMGSLHAHFPSPLHALPGSSFGEQLPATCLVAHPQQNFLQIATEHIEKA